MSLKHFKLVQEDKDAWHVQGKDGKAFKVAKGGLSATMHGRIAQHFAEGGEVLDEPRQDNWNSPSVKMEDAISNFSVGGAWDGLKSKLFPESPDDKRMRESQEAAAKVKPPAPADDGTGAASRFLGATATPPLAYDSGASAEERAQAPALPKTRTRSLSDLVPGTGGSGEAQPMTPAPAAPAAPGPGGGMGMGGGPNIQPQLDAATKAQKDALGQEAQTKVDYSKEALAYQQQSLQRVDAIQKQMQGDMADNEARQKKVADDIANSKIDPQAFWHSRTTGQKVSAVIGMALGAIAANHGAGGNPAMKLIDGAIEKDIDAQKANLSNKQSQLNYYMQKGHSIQQAGQLATADALQRTGAQIQMAATKYGGPQAQAAAQQASAELDQKGALMRQQVYKQGFEMRVQQEQLNLQRQQHALQQQAMAAQQQEAQTEAKLKAAVLSGDKVDPRAIEFIKDKDFRERVVMLPDGTPAVARTGKDAEEVNKSQTAASEMRGKLREYNALLKAHPNGISSALHPTDYAKAKALHSSILTDINGLAGLTRFTELEAGKYSDRLPDITGKQVPWSSGFQAQMEQLGSDIDNKVSSTNKSLLHMGRPRQSQQDLVTD